ncbi:ParB/RepB/Spo0J family partition protein [Tabrizicola oligotrophica]|uniref:ParB/RepB/Spo0J family partition protein n=1 Tax=Tabrizicola oligotrophica TaxID=2710650 RepID=A0A6M0QV00_9RHOB|nr:ParB/RepB/Spo0J family partition protein [Tabrizicola oligotrophica]NEY90302.1 ParB/RepB/Spo0J family partition protein [Tabrizicola oligotrophica]
MEKKSERRGLGRGLSALMADINLTNGAAPSASARRPDLLLPIEEIVPNPNQPRRTFEPAALKELADSIRQKGIIQPLIVRQIADSGKYEIVAGERRWRAAQIAQLHAVPAVLREFSDSEVLEIAIIENIQRAELNSIEEALAYRQLMDRFGHTQEKLAEALSRSRSHIANILRLLNLPDDVQSMVATGKLSAGHARALVTAPNAGELALKVVGKGLSVRETEDLVRKAGLEGLAPRRKRAPEDKDADTRALENDLAAGLGMGVRIDHDHSGGGKMTLAYRSLDQLDLLCSALSAAAMDASLKRL